MIIMTKNEPRLAGDGPLAVGQGLRRPGAGSRRGCALFRSPPDRTASPRRRWLRSAEIMQIIGLGHDERAAFDARVLRAAQLAAPRRRWRSSAESLFCKSGGRRGVEDDSP